MTVKNTADEYVSWDDITRQIRKEKLKLKEFPTLYNRLEEKVNEVEEYLEIENKEFAQEVYLQKKKVVETIYRQITTEMKENTLRKAG